MPVGKESIKDAIFFPLHWFAHRKRVLRARETKCKATILSESCPSCWREEIFKKYQKEKILQGLWHIRSTGNARMKQKKGWKCMPMEPHEEKLMKKQCDVLSCGCPVKWFPSLHCIPCVSLCSARGWNLQLCYLHATLIPQHCGAVDSLTLNGSIEEMSCQ